MQKQMKSAIIALAACMAIPAMAQKTDLVNPIIGTNGMGHTFPGACAPFGIVQVSPDTDTIPHNINGVYQPRVYEYCAGYQHKDSSIVGFSHTHFNGTGHSDLGDILLIKAPSISSHSFYYLGKLLRIIPKNGKESKPDWPSIEIEWYYQKSELTRNKTNQLDNSQVYNSLSEDEVFATNHKDIIFIETVVGKAKVLTLEEYDKYSTDENPNENIFFSRATYDPLTTEIEPAIDKWKTYCYCQMPYNPNLKYICCDKCGNWIHEKCIGKKFANCCIRINDYISWYAISKKF